MHFRKFTDADYADDLISQAATLLHRLEHSAKSMGLRKKTPKKTK